MEASSFPATSTTQYDSTSSDLLKRLHVTQWRQSPFLIASSRKTVQPFLHGIRSSHTACSVKVSCSRKHEDPFLEARYIVGLVGPPGAGKSTVASEVIQRLNKMWPQKAPSMDEQDPKEAHARRGAQWTFDPEKLLKCLQTLRTQGSVYAPSFDHGMEDPVEDAIFVTLQHKIVFVEGNYLFLEDGIWKDISNMFDEKWFIDVDLDQAMQQVLKKHMSLSGRSPEEARWQIEHNDRPNAELIMKTKKNADLVIKSIESSA